jgi:hypothetical protein
MTVRNIKRLETSPKYARFERAAVKAIHAYLRKEFILITSFYCNPSAHGDHPGKPDDSDMAAKMIA